MKDVFPILPKWKLFLNITPYLLSALIVTVSIFDRVGYYGFLCAGLFSVIPICLSLMSNNTVILVFEDGIQYRDGGLFVDAKWSELTELQEKQYLYFWKQSGVIVSNPTTHEVQLSLVTKLAYSLENPVRIKNSAFIPLSFFIDNWRDSELGKQIKQCAPHLFEKEKSMD